MIADLFAGPGGWAEGLRLLGLSEVGLEWDRAACLTRVAAGHRATIRTDVAAYPTAPFAGRMRTLIASPPCQAWSRAGKGLGLVDQPLVHQAVHDLAHGRDTRAELKAQCKDERSLLAAEPMRWHHDLRPETILMEEVPDVLPLWKQYAAILRGWGYSVWAGILNAADYGVPQTRRRAILIASRVHDVSAPDPTHAEHAEPDSLFGPSRARWISMAQALGWAPGVVVNTRGERKTAGGNEFCADEPSQTLVKAARSWVLKSRRDFDNWVAAHGERPNRGVDEPAPVFTGEAHRWSWMLRNGNQPNAATRRSDEPAPTMAFGINSARVEWVQDRPATAVCATDRIAPPGHRDRNPGGESQFASPDTVRITQAEAAVLQSFPADYPWQGTKTKQFEQIGNAVPPLIAAHIAAAGLGLNLADHLAAPAAA